MRRCAGQAGDRERRARSRFSKAGEGGEGVIIMPFFLCRGCERGEATRSGGHLSVAGGRSRTWCTKAPKGGFVCKCKPAAAHLIGWMSSLLGGWGGEGEWPWLERYKAYAFFHFCTLSFARDTPILLRDTDFDVFFRVTARWVN